jgi:hypothetical protein
MKSIKLQYLGSTSYGELNETDTKLPCEKFHLGVDPKGNIVITYQIDERNWIKSIFDPTDYMFTGRHIPIIWCDEKWNPKQS